MVFQSLSFVDQRLRALAPSAWSMSYADKGWLPGLIAPDAQVEFVFQVGAPCEMFSVASSAFTPSPRSMIYAQRRGALRLRSTGANAIIAFRTSPAVACAMLRHSLTGCWDRPVALADLIGPDGDDLASKLEETGAQAWGAILEDWIRRRLANWSPDDEEAEAMQGVLLRRSDALSDVAVGFGFGARTLRRRCATYSGLSPKQLANSGRILRACLLLRERRDLSLVDIADRTRFSDQSAFANAFRAHTGMTPRGFRAEPLVFCDVPSTWRTSLSAFCKTPPGRAAIPDEEEFGEQQ